MPQFAEDAVTNERWHADPALPPIQASLKFGYFLYAYVGDDLDWSFDRLRFAEVYQELETLLDDPGAISITVRVELWNLRSEVNEIRLDNGVTVRQLTASERSHSIAASRVTERFGTTERFDRYGMEPPVPGLYLELQRQSREYASPGLSPKHAVLWGVNQDVRRAAHAALLGLRLLTTGDFGMGLFQVDSDNRLLRVDGTTAISVAHAWLAPDPKRLKKQPRSWQRPHRREELDAAWGSYLETPHRDPQL